jgi:hypothetical protein
MVMVAAVTGCTSAVPGHGSLGPPPLTHARAATWLAMLDLAAASAVRYRGSFDDRGDFIDLDATVTSAGDATGTLTAGGNRIGLLVLQGATYLRAPEAFWSAGGARNGITRRYGNGWVRVPASLFGLDVGRVLAPAALARSQHAAIPLVSDGPLTGLPAGTLAGVPTVAVQAQSTRYDLSASPPYRLLRLWTPAVPRLSAQALPRLAVSVPPKPGTPLPEAPDAADLDLQLTDASAGLAGVYADLSRQAGQLGAAIDGQGRVTLGRQDFVGCGAGSCTIAVSFSNGSAHPARAALRADWTGGGRPIGGCDGTSATVAAHRTGTVTCTIRSPGWLAFYQRAVRTGGGLPYGARYSVLPLAPPPDAARLAAAVTAVRCGLAAERPAGCPAAGPAEVRDAAVQAGYRALGVRFGPGLVYGAVRGPRPAGPEPPAAHPAAGYPDLAVFGGDRLFVYQVAAPEAGEAARQQVARLLAALRDRVFDPVVRAEPGPPAGSLTVPAAGLGQPLTLSSRDGYPGVIFYAVG